MTPPLALVAGGSLDGPAASLPGHVPGRSADFQSSGAINAARTYAAGRAGVVPHALELLGPESVVWPDSALG